METLGSSEAYGRPWEPVTVLPRAAMSNREILRMAMPSSADRGTLLSAPELRSGLVRFVRGRVPEPDVEDVVQATLADAFAAREAPEGAEELRRWVFGIAKNKVVDVHRKGGREIPKEALGGEAAAESEPISARALLRWAENELPEGEGAENTLEWMLREGHGEKLEHIAEEAELPATRVRQRVSRLRKHFRARWAAELAAVAALAILALVLWALLKGRSAPSPEDIAREVPPDEQARELRRVALERCQARDFAACLDGLDRARAIDPVGDEASAIQEARAAARGALAPKPSPSTGPTPLPRDSKEDVKAPPRTKSAPVDSAPRTNEPPPPRKIQKMAPEKGTSSEFPMPQAPQNKKSAPSFDEQMQKK